MQTYHEQSCRMMTLDLYKYGKKFASSLPKSLWGKDNKECNLYPFRVPIKVVTNNPYRCEPGKSQH